MPSLNHIHSYQRLRGPKGKTAAPRTNKYKCGDPACTHWSTREEIHGKNCLCACGNVFQLSWDDLRRAVPRCQECSQTNEAKAHRRTRELVLRAMGGALEDLRKPTAPLLPEDFGDVRSGE